MRGAVPGPAAFYPGFRPPECDLAASRRYPGVVSGLGGSADLGRGQVERQDGLLAGERQAVDHQALHHALSC